MGFCLDRRVLVGLALSGAVVLLLRPAYLGAVLPLLIVLACPLSMLVMMRRGSGPASSSSAGSDSDLDALRTEIVQLRAEVQARSAPHDA